MDRLIRKTIRNDQVLPFYEQHDLPVLRILTDRGTEYCGKSDKHDYQPFLTINDIDHTTTKVKHPQTNGVCERFHNTILQELYQSIDQMQEDLDAWFHRYNTERTHQGKMCRDRTPMETIIDRKKIWTEKFVDQV